MFTGLVEDLGEILATRPRGKGCSLVIRTSLPVGDGIRLGDSIAVMGVCLTAEELTPPSTFTVSCGQETLACTTLGQARPGDRVHLERALALGDRLGGHLVSGHVDGLGTLERIEQDRESWILWIRAPESLARYIAAKGSVCLDGVSMTVNEVTGCSFRVNVIPHTSHHTVLTEHSAGDPLNIEVDLLARYLERLVQGTPAGQDGGLTFDDLANMGYGRGSDTTGESS